MQSCHPGLVEQPVLCEEGGISTSQLDAFSLRKAGKILDLPILLFSL